MPGSSLEPAGGGTFPDGPDIAIGVVGPGARLLFRAPPEVGGSSWAEASAKAGWVCDEEDIAEAGPRSARSGRLDI